MSAIAEKIRKLIAHADSTAHPEEADAFMGKAHALLEAHGLSMLDLGKLGDDPVALEKDAFEHSAAYGFMTKVVSAMAKYYGCNVVICRHGKNESYAVAGRESARVTLTLMVPFVHRQIMNLGREGYNAGKYANRMQAVTRIGNAVALRIWAMCRESEKATVAAGRATTGINALVPVDIIAAAVAEAFPNLRQSKATSLTTDSYSKQAAEKVNLNSQVGRKSGALQIGNK